MLILNREPGQRIFITHNGEVMNFLIRKIQSGGIVEIMFEAPKSFNIVRHEIYQEPVNNPSILPG